MDVLVWVIVTLAIVALVLGAVWGLDRLAKRPPTGDRGD